MITDPAFSSPFLPRLTWKRGEKAVYFQVPGYQGIGVIPGLEIGWLAYKSSPFLPRETVFSPLFPHKWEVGKLRKKCHNVPNVSGECLKTRDFEVQSECPNTPLTSTILKILRRPVFWSVFSFRGWFWGWTGLFAVPERIHCFRISLCVSDDLPTNSPESRGRRLFDWRSKSRGNTQKNPTSWFLELKNEILRLRKNMLQSIHYQAINQKAYEGRGRKFQLQRPYHFQG